MIPEVSDLKNEDDIHNALVALFSAYKAERSGGLIDYDKAMFRVKLPQRSIEFEITMPDFYRWLFYQETPAELEEGIKVSGKDYEPMRCLPIDVSDAWQRLLLYRASRFLAILAADLKNIQEGKVTFNQVFRDKRIIFDGHCGLLSSMESTEVYSRGGMLRGTAWTKPDATEEIPF